MKKTKKTKRGGARAGAGRPTQTEQMRRVSVQAFEGDLVVIDLAAERAGLKRSAFMVRASLEKAVRDDVDRD